MVRVDYLSITGQVIRTARYPLTFEEAVSAVEARDWDGRTAIRAVRISDRYRSVIRRRPTDVYGPGHLPRLRATTDTPRLRATKRAMNGL